jgi:hypothetical protein
MYVTVRKIISKEATLKAHHDVEVTELEPCLLVRHEDLQILGQLIDGLSVVPLAPIDKKKINRFLSLLCSHKCWNKLKGTSNQSRTNVQDIVINLNVGKISTLITWVSSLLP